MLGEFDAAEVACRLGVSRRRVIELTKSAGDFPRATLGPARYRLWPGDAIHDWAATHNDRGPMYSPPELPIVEARLHIPERMTPQMQAVFELAHAEAVALNHCGVDPNHLALALLHPECPGAARDVLESLGLRLEAVREAWLESMGDVADPHELEVKVAPAMWFALERAKLEALDLRDEEVTSEHVLLDLIEASDRQISDQDLAARLVTPGLLSEPSAALRLLWREGPPGPLALFMYPGGVEAGTVRSRALALTEDASIDFGPSPPPPAAQMSAIELRWHGMKPEFARSPIGHDPERRGPWGSGVFPDPEGGGSGIMQGNALLQYRIDRDGYPVRTTDGRPVHLLIDEEGNLVLDERGMPLQTVIATPPGSELRAYRLQDWH